MYTKELEELIEAVIADGTITEKERNVLHRRAEEEGEDPEELDVLIEGRIASKNNFIQSPAISLPPPIPEAPTLKTVKYGNVKKCPNCGEIVKPGYAVCSSCGLEFRDIDAINSVRKLAEEITIINNKYPDYVNDEKNNVSPGATSISGAIANFPIPNAKEDLLEFIVFTESKFLHLNNSTKSEVAILKAYKAKYIESVEKAKIYFSNDSQFSPIFEKYEKNQKRKWREMNPDARNAIIWGGFYVFLLALMFILIFTVE